MAGSTRISPSSKPDTVDSCRAELQTCHLRVRSSVSSAHFPSFQRRSPGGGSQVKTQGGIYLPHLPMEEGRAPPLLCITALTFYIHEVNYSWKSTRMVSEFLGEHMSPASLACCSLTPPDFVCPPPPTVQMLPTALLREWIYVLRSDARSNTLKYSLPCSAHQKNQMYTWSVERTK